DPTYPKERISYMLEDVDCEIVLSQKHLELPKNNSEIIYLDADWDKIENEPTENIKSEVKSSNLAYVIYTSGSMGQPKGTLIGQKNVVRLFFNDKFQFNFSEKDVWTLFHSYCFDFSVWEMYGALLFGGKLVIVSKESTRDTEQFCQLLENHNVTVLNQTPSAFYNLSNEVKRKQTALSIRYVIFGGEALIPSRLRFWYDNYTDCKLINMYGITETTVHVTYKEINEVEINNNICNIGKPIPTLSTYILDKNKNLLPIGVPGELCITGAGVGKGYLNNDILSVEKFQDNPFVQGEKIYMSGDSAYVNKLGELIYCGRIDNQVKIRGFRIELGEIESALNKIEAIKDCVLVAKEDLTGNKRLVAYIVSNNEL
ncbi:MAG: amino acid adenylation domain-containing protein, partial [bacterium]|nr:amino acid adenylation domain-containing protein [bacterium]